MRIKYKVFFLYYSFVQTLTTWSKDGLANIRTGLRTRARGACNLHVVVFHKIYTLIEHLRTSVHGFMKNWAWLEIVKKFTCESLPSPEKNTRTTSSYEAGTTNG